VFECVIVNYAVLVGWLLEKSVCCECVGWSLNVLECAGVY